MRLLVNGEAREVVEGTTLQELLHSLDLPAGRIAVERNREVVRRDRFAEVALHEGDQIEIVRFVGGG